MNNQNMNRGFFIKYAVYIFNIDFLDLISRY